MVYAIRFPDGTLFNNISDDVDPADAKAQIIAKYPQYGSKERTWGDVATDTGASLASGIGAIAAAPGQLTQLVPGLAGVGASLQKPGAALQDWAQGFKSEGLKVREALRNKAISEAEKEGMLSEFVTAIGQTIKDPALLGSFMAEQLPMLIPGLGAAKIAQLSKAAKVAGAGAGLEGVAAKEAIAAAQAAANKTATRAALGTGTAMQSADVSGDTYKEAMKSLKDRPDLSDEQKQEMALTAARKAAALAAAFSVGSMAIPGAQAIEGRLAGVPGMGRVKSALGETAQEMVEEGGGAFSKNVGMQPIDPSRSLTQGIGSAAGLGAIGGGIFGAALGSPAPAPELVEGQQAGETLRQAAERTQQEILDLRAMQAEQAAAEQEAAQQAAQTGISSLFGGNVPTQRQRPSAQSPAEFNNLMTQAAAVAPQDQGIQVLMKAAASKSRSASQSPADFNSLLAQTALAEPAVAEGIASMLAAPETRATPSRTVSPAAFDTLLAPDTTPAPPAAPPEIDPGLAKILQAIGGQGASRTQSPSVANNLLATEPEPAAPPAPPVIDPGLSKILEAIGSPQASKAKSPNVANKLLATEPLPEAPVVAAPGMSDILEATGKQAPSRVRSPLSATNLLTPEPIDAPTEAGTEEAAAEADVGTATGAGVPLVVEPSVPATTGVKQPKAQRGRLAVPAPDVAGAVGGKGVPPASVKKSLASPEPIGEGMTEVPFVQPVAPSIRSERLTDLQGQVGTAEKQQRKIIRNSHKLWTALRGKLDIKSVRDISPDKSYNVLASAQYGRDLSSLVADGEVDAFLPYDMRTTSESFDEINSTNHVRELLATSKTNLDYENQIELRKLNQSINELTTEINELLTEQEANELLQQAYNDQSRLDQQAEEAEPEGKDRSPRESVSEEKPRAEVAQPEIDAQIAEKTKQLGNILTKIMGNMGLRDVALNIVDDLKNANAEYSNRLIRLALDAQSPVRDLRHESIHAMKEMGFFSDKQWATLEKMATDKWIKQYLGDVNVDQQPLEEGEQTRLDAYRDMFKRQGLSDADAQAALIEEAIADAFGTFDIQGAPSGLLSAILKRMQDMFAAIKTAIGGDQTAEQIFRKVERGGMTAQNAWKASPEENEKAADYEEENGIEPYISEGRLDLPTKFSMKLKEKRLKDGTSYGMDALSGMPLNKDGTVTVYYHTTKPNVITINAKKMIPAEGRNRVYVTNESSGAKILGGRGSFDQELDGSTVLLHLPPSMLQLDQEYPDGRKDFFVPLAQGDFFNRKMQAASIQAERTKAIAEVFSYKEHEERIAAAVSEYQALDKKGKEKRLKQARALLKKEHNVGTLMTENGKLEKTRMGGLLYEGQPIDSMGLGLAAAQQISEKLSSCPNAAICEGLCLGETSGGNKVYGGAAQEDVGDIAKSAFRAGPRMMQYLKTEALVIHPEDFAIVLQSEIDSLVKWDQKTEVRKKNPETGVSETVEKDVYQSAVRLNVTSDFRGEMWRGVIENNPNVMFYDYTKLVGNLPIAENHHLTYSSTGFGQEVEGKQVFFKTKSGKYNHNWTQIRNLLNSGKNAAMAFSSKSSLPEFLRDEETGVTYKVLDGDDYDARFLDESSPLKQDSPYGVIVGLRNKASTLKEKTATEDTGGFFANYDPKVDGDTVTVPTQTEFGAPPYKAPGKTILIAKQSIRAPDTKEFKQWFGDSKVVDENGEPLVLYRGVRGESQGALNAEPRDGYNVFASDSPAVAATYGMPDQEFGTSGAIVPVFVKANKLIEFPVSKDRNGYSIFDKAEFDRRARLLVPGQVLVARQVVDIGPMAREAYSVDMTKQYTYPSDVYAWGVGTSVKSATGNSGQYDIQSQDIRKSIRAPKTQEFKTWFADSKIVDENGEPKVMFHGTARDITAFRAKQAGAIFVTDQPGFAETFADTSADWMSKNPEEFFTKEEIAAAKLEAIKAIKASKKGLPITSKNFLDDVIALLQRSARNMTGIADEAIAYLEGNETPSKDVIEYAKEELKNQFIGRLPTGQNIMPVFVKAENPFDYDNKDDVDAILGELRSAYDYKGTNYATKYGLDIESGNWETIEMATVQAAIKKANFDGFYVKENGVKNLAVYDPTQIKSAIGNQGTFDVTNPDIRKSLRSTLPPALMQRIDQTTTARKDEGHIGRMLNAISPGKHTTIRAELLNRYDALSQLDKIRIQQMGGAAAMADISSESAALLSDLGAGITASALGVHDKVGGAPVYVQSYYVVRNGRILPRRYATRAQAQSIAGATGEVRSGGHTAVGNFNNTVKGPLSIFAPLAKRNDPDIYRLYQFWAAAKRGKRFDTEGREFLITPADQQLAADLERRFPEFVDIQKEWTKYNDKLVQYMVDTGVLTPEKGKIYTQYADYIPFYRQVEGERTAGPKVFAAISSVKPPKEAKGSQAPLDDFLETIVRNTQSAIQSGVKNLAAQRAVEAAQDVGLAVKIPAGNGLPSTVTVLVDGVPTHYDCKDALFVNAMKSLGMAEIPFLNIISAPANWLRAAVTKEPTFMLANLLRDSLSSYVTSGVKMTPVVDTMANFAKTLVGKSPEFDVLRRAGIVGGYEFTQGVETSGRKFGEQLKQSAGVKEKGLKRVGKAITSPVTGIWNLLEKGSEASDAATRQEIYKKTLAETGNETEAIFRSLEVMNFNRKGRNAGVRLFTAMIPFLNARMQGLDILYRTAIRPSLPGQSVTAREKELQHTFMVRGATMAALSCMYWMLTNDDDEYKKQEEETKDNYWLIPSLGIKIPIPFEVGVLFKVVPERIMALVFGDDTFDEFRTSMSTQIINTLKVNPIPQAFLPLVENVFNKSAYTLRPIVSPGMEDIDPGYQVAPNTTTLMADLGKSLGVSPILMEHAIQGYTGQMGMYLVSLLDAVYDINSTTPRPSKQFEQLPLIKRFAVDPNARGSVTTFYKLKDEVDSAVKTLNLMERTGNYEEYEKYMDENINLLASKEYISQLANTMKELAEAKVMIRSSTDSAEEKRQALLEIQQMENELTADIKELREFAHAKD